MDISLNIKMFLTHHWPPYPTLISQPIGLMTSFPASVLAHKFLEKYSTICLSGNSVSANKVQQWNPQKEESTFLCVYVTSFQPGAQCPKEVEVTQSADIIDWPTWGRGVDAYFLFSDDSVSQDFAFYILLVIFYLVLIIIQFECILDRSRSLSYFVPQVPKSSWLESCICLNANVCKSCSIFHSIFSSHFSSLSHWNIFPAFCQKYLLALLLASAPNLEARGLQNSSQRK